MIKNDGCIRVRQNTFFMEAMAAINEGARVLRMRVT